MNYTDYCGVIWENRHYIKELENVNMAIDFAYGFSFACFIFGVVFMFLYIREIRKSKR